MEKKKRVHVYSTIGRKEAKEREREQREAQGKSIGPYLDPTDHLVFDSTND